MSAELEVIDNDAQSVALTAGPANLFNSDNPRETVARIADTAAALTDILKTKKLYASIQGKNHVLVEGWTLLGSMLGVFPVCVWTHRLEDGWEARVEARTLAGVVVGAAEAECRTSEKRWASADSYAIRSMAQTRATSKALRQPLGFVVKLAGYEATPAEEIPREEFPGAALPSELGGTTLTEADSGSPE